MQAVEAARTAAKSISENIAEDSESSKEDGTEASAVEEESDDENDERRKAALDKLEKASKDSFLSQVVHMKSVCETCLFEVVLSPFFCPLLPLSYSIRGHLLMILICFCFMLCCQQIHSEMCWCLFESSCLIFIFFLF